MKYEEVIKLKVGDKVKFIIPKEERPDKKQYDYISIGTVVETDIRKNASIINPHNAFDFITCDKGWIYFTWESYNGEQKAFEGKNKWYIDPFFHNFVSRLVKI